MDVGIIKTYFFPSFTTTTASITTENENAIVVQTIFFIFIIFQIVKTYIDVYGIFIDFIFKPLISIGLHLIQRTPRKFTISKKLKTNVKPDYSKDYFWASLPATNSSNNNNNNNAELVPINEKYIEPSERLCDLFFVHPTGFYNSSWNESLNMKNLNPAATEQTNNWMLATQASAFNESCRIYAPHYRQAHIESFFCNKIEGRNALDLAYEDVKAAFYDFLYRIKEYKIMKDYVNNNNNNNRRPPFVLASHSQGGWHLMRLIEEEIDCNPRLRTRVICIYLLGSRMPMKKFEEYKFFKPSLKANDIHCIIGWDTLSTEWKWGHMSRLSSQWPGNYSKQSDDNWEDADTSPILNTNPFTWKSNDYTEGKIYSTKTNYLGSIVSETTLQRPYTILEFTGGKALNFTVLCLKKIFPKFKSSNGDGRLWVKVTDNGLMVPPLEQTSSMGLLTSVLLFGWYHCLDYELFYFNIRENVNERVNTYFSNYI